MNKAKQALFAFFCFALILAGCKNKSSTDASASKQSSIVGKWTMNQNHTTKGDSVTVMLDTTVFYSDGKIYLNVNGDGTYTFYDNGESLDTGTFEIKKDIIVFYSRKYPDAQTEADITTLSEHKMVLMEDKDYSGMRMQVTQTYTR